MSGEPGRRLGIGIPVESNRRHHRGLKRRFYWGRVKEVVEDEEEEKGNNRTACWSMLRLADDVIPALAADFA